MNGAAIGKKKSRVEKTKQNKNRCELGGIASKGVVAVSLLFPTGFYGRGRDE